MEVQDGEAVRVPGHADAYRPVFDHEIVLRNGHENRRYCGARTGVLTGEIDGLRADLADRLPRRPAEDRLPLLVVQGTEDRILPIDATGRRIPELVKDVQFVEVEEGPHDIGWTHPDEVNEALIKFIGEATT